MATLQERCQWHAGALLAARKLAPWVDERVIAAMQDVVAVLARGDIPQPRRSTCLEMVFPFLNQLATDPHKLGVRHHLMSLLELAVQRYQLILRIGPDVPGANIMRYHLAEALFTAQRYCEAALVYARVVVSDPLGQKRDDAALGAYLAGAYCWRS